MNMLGESPRTLLYYNLISLRHVYVVWTRNCLKGGFPLDLSSVRERLLSNVQARLEN